MNNKFKDIIKKLVPYRIMDELVTVTFYFSDISENDYEIIEAILNKNGGFFNAGVHTDKKIAYSDFYKEKLNIDAIILDLQKADLSLVPEKTTLKPSKEHELNCITIVILGIIVYFFLKVLL